MMMMMMMMMVVVSQPDGAGGTILRSMQRESLRDGLAAAGVTHHGAIYSRQRRRHLAGPAFPPPFPPHQGFHGFSLPSRPRVSRGFPIFCCCVWRWDYSRKRTSATGLFPPRCCCWGVRRGRRGRRARGRWVARYFWRGRRWSIWRIAGEWFRRRSDCWGDWRGRCRDGGECGGKIGGRGG